MRQSARRTRSLFIRYAVVEAIAFPGIRTEWPSFPYTRSHSSTFVTTGHASHTKSKPSCIASTRSGAPALAGAVPGCRVGLGRPHRAYTALSTDN